MRKITTWREVLDIGPGDTQAAIFVVILFIRNGVMVDFRYGARLDSWLFMCALPFALVRLVRVARYWFDRS